MRHFRASQQPIRSILLSSVALWNISAGDTLAQTTSADGPNKFVAIDPAQTLRAGTLQFSSASIGKSVGTNPGAVTLNPGAVTLRDPHPLTSHRWNRLLAEGVTSSPLVTSQTVGTLFSGFATEPLLHSQDAENTASQAEDESEKILFEADEISREEADGPIVAQGNVRAFFGTRYLTAEKLIYDPNSNIVTADGQVSITDTNAETVFAERVELTGDLRDGIAESFSALLAENARMAADNAVREQNARTHLSKVVYTACNVCKENGESTTPTWRIKALRVTRDEERKVIRFRHAFLELKGVPILYTPFIQAPDPSVERQSGFLTPTIGTSSRLSGFVEIPYYFAISNHQDLTFFPKFTLSDGTLWQGEYRRAGRNSFHAWAGGVIDFTRPPLGPNGLPIVEPGTPPEDIPEDAPGVRWYYFGRGYHNITDNFRIGYDVERTSDDTFLRRYAVRRRGDLRLEFDRALTNRLRSNFNTSWQIGRSELTTDSYLFQGLRTQDISALTPYVLPTINFRHDFRFKPGGGDLSINANFASLQRTGGTDSRRFTAQAFWNREHITRSGHRLNAFAELRGDAFFQQDLDEGTDNILNELVERSNGTTDIIGRFTPTAGLEWSYPLVKPVGTNARLLITPRVQLIASPANRNSNAIINEDSQTTEFDFNSLFDFNKSTGFDAVEDGQRFNVGLTGAIAWNNGIKLETSIGQQFRLQDTNAFSFGTGRGDLFFESVGLGDDRSDYVGEFNLLFGNKVDLRNNFRIDTNLRLRQLNSSLGFRLWRFGGGLNYIRLEDVLIDTTQRDLGNLTSNTIESLDQIDALDDIEEVNAALNFRLTKHWSIGGQWRENLRVAPDEEGTIRQDFALTYNDDCSLFQIVVRRDLTRDIGLEPDTSVLVRFTLNSLTSSNFIQQR